MEKFILHYADLYLNEDIPKYSFLSIEGRKKFIKEIFTERIQNNNFSFDRVYLITQNNYVFITEDHELVIRLDEFPIFQHPQKFPLFIFEFSSYEDAFDMAKDLSEHSHLCYKNNDTENLILN